MLIFATSDKGGTGRSVTSSNILYRSALQGSDVCYLDFDFGSPTSGAIFNIPAALHGTTQGGLHSYLHGIVADPQRLEIWQESDRSSLRSRPPGAGRLVLLPGDSGGGEFPITKEMIDRCARLFLHLEEEFDLLLVDLSAGRSYATEMVLAATASEALRNIRTRWLVFHRWTRQHVLAAAGLVYGERGILHTGVSHGHDRDELANALRFVRTAVVNPDSPELEGLRPAQVAWLRDVDRDLSELASSRKVGRTLLLGSIPLDPVLQWREQLISDNDVWSRRIANRETLEQFDSLAKKIVDDAAWETL
ncbi:SCO2523 family variant P-loop protein [Asanoa sp. WMMD1127]|uniref:SCO2523 family variant P-loop protein n=1 Tax=Asanoa sp. WMMD1127 TaxID=3016107 RepID=UPI00241788F4|nr:SCO2523 family variant P-loop protein [Asanoa sp. WMMD1127]MDG4821793.1 SCO2523 family variant P-loop protein [Asanoa sp. WMMD1127]